jgi:hypothetical protein
LNAAVAAHLGQAGAHAPPTYADVTSLPATQRQHPRRCSVSKDRRPPLLVRQRDRKIDFVDNLVGKHTFDKVLMESQAKQSPRQRFCHSNGRGHLAIVGTCLSGRRR